MAPYSQCKLVADVEANQGASSSKIGTEAVVSAGDQKLSEPSNGEAWSARLISPPLGSEGLLPEERKPAAQSLLGQRVGTQMLEMSCVKTLMKSLEGSALRRIAMHACTGDRDTSRILPHDAARATDSSQKSSRREA
jgi:hypothetical protein